LPKEIFGMIIAEKLRENFSNLFCEHEGSKSSRQKNPGAGKWDCVGVTRLLRIHHTLSVCSYNSVKEKFKIHSKQKWILLEEFPLFT
jgi:hypothetical protein